METDNLKKKQRYVVQTIAVALRTSYTQSKLVQDSFFQTRVMGPLYTDSCRVYLCWTRWSMAGAPLSFHAWWRNHLRGFFSFIKKENRMGAIYSPSVHRCTQSTKGRKCLFKNYKRKQKITQKWCYQYFGPVICLVFSSIIISNHLCLCWY